MNKIKYDYTILNYMSVFESLTLARLKDCIVNKDYIIFIVHENEAAKAIGKNGANAKRLAAILNRKIKIVEFNSDMLRFISNLLYPLKPSISKNKDDVVIRGDTKTKALLIGRDSQNINNNVSIIKRYFNVNNIQVL